MKKYCQAEVMIVITTKKAARMRVQIHAKKFQRIKYATAANNCDVKILHARACSDKKEDECNFDKKLNMREYYFHRHFNN